MSNETSHNYRYEQTMPNFFVVKNDTVEYKFNNVLYKICTIAKGSRTPSIATAVESGLNHWLDYWYHTNEDTYKIISESLFDTYTRIFNYISNVRSNGKSVYNTRAEMIDKFCYPSKTITKSFIHYIIDLTVCNMKREEATTDVTITNGMATTYAICSYYFKFMSVFSEMNPNIKLVADSDKDDCVIFEKLVHDCCVDIIDFGYNNPELESKMNEIYEVDSIKNTTPDDLKSSVYDFIAERAGVLWDKSSTSAYDNKYLEVGYDGNWNERVSVNSVFKACKKFSAPLKDDDDDALILKYATSVYYRDIPTKELKESGIHYMLGFDYDDFRFVTKQAASYVQNCLKNTNKTVITKQTIASINVNNIMHADSEAIRKQEMSLLEDNKSALYDMRIDNSQTFFRETMKELSRHIRKTNISNIFEFANEFDISKSHRLNAYILAKIFLSLNGERDIYRDIFGVYSRLFLALFYVRIITDSKYSKFRDIVECMRMFPSVIAGDMHKASVDEFIKTHELHEDLSIPFQNICRGYSNGDVTGGIDTDHFYEFFVFMSDPYNVRHIINPTMYTDTKSDELKITNLDEDVVYKCMTHIS